MILIYVDINTGYTTKMRVRLSVLRRRLAYSAVFLGLFLYVTSDDYSWFAFFEDRAAPPRQTPLSRHKEAMNMIGHAIERGGAVPVSTRPLPGVKTVSPVKIQIPPEHVPRVGWQVVVVDQIWVYSAYLDRRDMKPVLAIFGMVPKNMWQVIKFKCRIRDYPFLSTGEVVPAEEIREEKAGLTVDLRP